MYGRPQAIRETEKGSKMGADDNLATVKTIYDAFGKGDVDTILGLLADDVDWSAEAAGGGAPWYGRRTNREEVAEFFAEIGAALEVQEFTPKSFAANDADEVMVLIHFRVTSQATGRSAEMDLHHYWRFRDGRVVTYRGTEDTAQMQAAIGGTG
jgi:ketosteroid isomerase-like protein